MTGSKFMPTNTNQLNKPNNHRASLDFDLLWNKHLSNPGPAPSASGTIVTQ